MDIAVRTTATETQDTTVHQENTQLDKTDSTSSERLQRSQERRRQPCMMTREESMLPREAYDALERKRTLHCNQGQPEDEEKDDKDVDIMVRTTATGTQDTTVHQEITQLDKTNCTSSETAPIPNVRHSPVIPLDRRSEPIVINDNNIICGICNNNIVRDIDMGHIISDGCKYNLNYHYNCLLTMRNRYAQRKRNMKCSMSQCQKQIYAIQITGKRDLIGESQDANSKCCLCQDSTHYHIELGQFIPTNIGRCTCKDVTWHFECLWSWYNNQRFEFSQSQQHNRQLQCPICRGNITGIGRAYL